jgi:hypothetical protein
METGGSFVVAGLRKRGRGTPEAYGLGTDGAVPVARI